MRLTSLLGLMLGLLACAKGGEGDAGIPLCNSGEQIFCRCEDGSGSTRACLDGGQGFGECLCDGSGWDDGDDDGWDPPDFGDGAGDPGTGASGAGAGWPGTGGDPSGPSSTSSSGAGGDPSGSGPSSTTTGPSGPSSSSSGPGPTGPTKPLLAPCTGDGQCDSGMCKNGYCTKSCAKVADCPFPHAECMPGAPGTSGGGSLCLARCDTAASCSLYGTPNSKCGFGYSLDHWRVSVCANWAPDKHALVPTGSDCMPHQHKACNLGYDKRERVCGDDGACAEGCFVASDCPAATSCDAEMGASEPGSCFGGP